MRIFILIFLFFNVISLNARLNEGLYIETNQKMLMKVMDDTLCIYSLDLWYLNTWGEMITNPQAKCIITYEGNNYIKINSLEPYFYTKVEDSTEYIVKKGNTKSSEKMEVNLIMPNVHSDCMQVKTSPSADGGEIVERQDSVYHWEKFKYADIAFQISPKQYDSIFNKQYLGITSLIVYKKYFYEEGDVAIDVIMHDINDFTFSNFLIFGEYIKIRDYKLTWRDMEFKYLEEDDKLAFINSYENYLQNRWKIMKYVWY